MLHSLVSTLVAYPILTLFVVIGLGYVFGSISFGGFKFGVAGVLFVGLAIGALDPNLGLPELIPSLGLIIFVYTIGLQAGPGFFRSFNRQGARDNLLALGVLAVGALLTVALAAGFGFDRTRAAGLYCGALTNTPALAAVRERVRETARNAGVTGERLDSIGEQPSVAYSLAYPFGVIGLLLAFQLGRRLWKPVIAPPDEQRRIAARDFVVRNPGVFHRRLSDVLHLHHNPGFVVSRLRHDGETVIPGPETELAPGDIVVAVGDDEALERAQQIFGEPADTQLELDRSRLDFRRVFVSSERVVGRRIGDLGLERDLGATITRLRRGDVDVVPTADTRLEYGDRVRVLTRRESFEAISRFFGDSIRGTAETDFGSVAVGMVLGVLVGLMPIPLPGAGVVRLGLAGGPLLVALVLGRIERTGRITWHIPVSANLTLRQVGLLLFLAGVGTRAGWSFVQTLRTSGLELLAAGAIITTFVAVTTLVFAYKKYALPFDFAIGLVAGVHTQPAALAYAADTTRSERPNLAYAAVYPLATIAKIVIAQLLLS